MSDAELRATLVASSQGLPITVALDCGNGPVAMMKEDYEKLVLIATAARMQWYARGGIPELEYALRSTGSAP